MRIKKTSTKTPDDAKILNQQSNSRTDAYSCNYIETAVMNAVNNLLPIGSIIEYGGTTAPEGWLLCDGSAVSRTTYASLFSTIGTSFGTGDGSTTFNIPNKKGKVGVGLDSTDTNFNTIGKTGGSKEHYHNLDDNNSYAKLTMFSGNSEVGYYELGGKTQWQSNFGATLSSVGGRTHTSIYGVALGGYTANGSSLQPYITLNYIIKAI